MQTVLGRYELRATIAAGALSTVFDGWDKSIERRVAIKGIPLAETGHSEGWQQRTRIKREAQAAGRLQHPNVVAIFDYGETPEFAYIVMEFVEGVTLKAVLDKETRLPSVAIGRLMSDILAGLQYSHERGVVHRDIKPSNVMVTHDGRAKIADFGIARFEDSNITQIGTVMGTPAYMSPEQLTGGAIDARTDIYSAGVVLYELLTGKRPFDGGYATIMHKALNTDAPGPSAISATVPRSFDGVVGRAMAKRPEQRFRDAQEFAQAVADAITAPPSPGLRPVAPSAPPLPPRCAIPSRTLVIAGTLGLMVVAVGGIAAYRAAQPGSVPAPVVASAPTAAPPRLEPAPAPSRAESAPVPPRAEPAVSPMGPVPAVPEQASRTNDQPAHAAPVDAALDPSSGKTDTIAPAPPKEATSAPSPVFAPVITSLPLATPILPTEATTAIAAPSAQPLLRPPPPPAAIVSAPSAQSAKADPFAQRPLPTVRKDVQAGVPRPLVKKTPRLAADDPLAPKITPSLIQPSGTQPSGAQPSGPMFDRLQETATGSAAPAANHETGLPSTSGVALQQNVDVAAPRLLGSYDFVNGRRVYVPAVQPEVDSSPVASAVPPLPKSHSPTTDARPEDVGVGTAMGHTAGHTTDAPSPSSAAHQDANTSSPKLFGRYDTVNGKRVFIPATPGE